MAEPALRIGELADLAGVSTRTVRHYHHIGLLAEPERLANGYRSYGLAHMVALLRIRRLAELGLSLDEIGDALAEGGDADLRELLAERDRDLAARADKIEIQRAAIAALLARADDLRTPEYVGKVMATLREAFGPEHPSLKRDEMIFEFLDIVTDPESVSPSEWTAQVLGDAQLASAMAALGRRFEALADLGPDDPEVEAVATEGAALMAGVEAEAPVTATEADPDLVQGFFKALRADLSPAQLRCLALWFPDSPLGEELE